jgi:hypothetical protein
MNGWTAIVVVVALLVVGALAWMYLRRRRTGELRSRFGPEYDHVMQERGDRRQAERELKAREKRIERLTIRPLRAEERAKFAERWRAEQSRFVDEPREAVRNADHLVEEVMKERGYPVSDFWQRAADVSVDHPRLVENYRSAHDVAERNERGEAQTEDLRNAMLCYRSLFEDLLEDPQPALREARA